MATNLLPDIDYKKLEELRKRLPDLSDVDVSPPNLEQVGKRAEEAVDRILGRRRAPVWPWVAVAIGLMAVAGLVAAWLTWTRRAPWTTDGAETPMADHGYGSTTDFGSEPSLAGESGAGWDPATSSGLTAAESSLATAHDLGERA